MLDTAPKTNGPATIFSTATAASSLTNGTSLPVFLIMDCLNGFFQDVYEEPLAVALMLAPNGGAVAVLASSGLNQAPPQTILDKLIVQAAMSSPQPLWEMPSSRRSQASPISPCAKPITCLAIPPCESSFHKPIPRTDVFWLMPAPYPQPLRLAAAALRWPSSPSRIPQNRGTAPHPTAPAPGKDALQ